MQYRCTPLECGYSPAELLNGRQIRCKLDALLHSPDHVAQGRLSKETAKTHRRAHRRVIADCVHAHMVETPCYARYCGYKHDKEPRWIPAAVTKIFGMRTVQVRVVPRGPLWKRHIEQLQTSLQMGRRRRSGACYHSPQRRHLSDKLRRRHSRRVQQRSRRGLETCGPGKPRRSKRLQQKLASQQGTSFLAGRYCGCGCRLITSALSLITYAALRLQ
uniref:Uncharacterized protein n=1 Tax=Trichuris muris TaxID=70415 RepID=A0A5S6QNE6_TRIMR